MFDKNEDQSTWVEVTGFVLQETAKAILMVPDGWGDEDAIWLPKSQIEGSLAGGEHGTIQIVEWLAHEKGLE